MIFWNGINYVKYDKVKSLIFFENPIAQKHKAKMCLKAVKKYKKSEGFSQNKPTVNKDKKDIKIIPNSC